MVGHSAVESQSMKFMQLTSMGCRRLSTFSYCDVEQTLHSVFFQNATIVNFKYLIKN